MTDTNASFIGDDGYELSEGWVRGYHQNGHLVVSDRDAYYRDKRSKFPPKCEREKGKDYSEGARVNNLANPIRYFD
jgi:hypothetical protein